MVVSVEKLKYSRSVSCQIRGLAAHQEGLLLLQLHQRVQKAPQDADHQVGRGRAPQPVAVHDLGTEHVAQQQHDDRDIDQRVQQQRPVEQRGTSVFQGREAQSDRAADQAENQRNDSAVRPTAAAAASTMKALNPASR